MLIRDKKHFVMGSFMILVFAGILLCMFMPIYKGHNALEYSDKLFNSMAKGSTYYIKNLEAKAEAYKGTVTTLKLKAASPQRADLMEKILSPYGEVSREANVINYTADLGEVMNSALEDSDNMFFNKDKAIEEKYGMSGKTAMYAWWLSVNAIESSLKFQKKFKVASQFAEINKKAVEVGYNFFGIDSEEANEEIKLLIFSLVFYVFYTLWWGIAILSMFQAFGLKMTRGAKTEA